MKKPLDRVKVCRMCRQMFESYNDKETCPTCSVIEDKKFAEVRNYIRSSNGTVLHEVAAACAVEESLILTWVREERLTFTQESGIVIDCEKCGKPIVTGKFCSTCKRDLIKSFESACLDLSSGEKKTMTTNEEKRMRFQNR